MLELHQLIGIIVAGLGAVGVTWILVRLARSSETGPDDGSPYWSE